MVFSAKCSYIAISNELVHVLEMPECRSKMQWNIYEPSESEITPAAVSYISGWVLAKA